MKRPTNKEIDFIYSLIPDVRCEELKDNDNYECICFSVFDHWLTEEEYVNADLYFINELTKEENQTFCMYENHFKKFYKSVYNKYSTYLLIGTDASSARVLCTENFDEYMSYVVLSIRQELYATILIPQLSLILVGGFDLTNYAYIYKKSKSQLLKTKHVLYELLAQNNLHILPKN